MEKQPSDLPKLLASLRDNDYCYLTTVGRVTGNPHEVEIWFGLNGTTLYILSGGLDKSDWVKNSKKNPAVKVRIAKQNFNAVARIVQADAEQMLARTLLADKYKERESDGSLSEWAQTALVVAFDIAQGD